MRKSLESGHSSRAAFEKLAITYRFLGIHGYVPFINAIDKARASVTTALELNDELAVAHSVLAAVELMEDDLDAAEIEAKRAIEINPSLAEAHSSLADIVAARGNLNESITLREKAYELDPLEPWNLTSLGDEYHYAGRDSEALEIWSKSLKLAPYLTYDSMMDYHIQRGEYGRASELVHELEKLDPDNPENNFWSGYVAAITGDKPKAEKEIATLEEFAKKGSTAINGIAHIYYALGDLDTFFKYAFRALHNHSLSLVMIRFSPLLAKAREDPRMAELLRRH